MKGEGKQKLRSILHLTKQSKNPVGRMEFWRSSRWLIILWIWRLQVLFSPQPDPSRPIKKQLRELGQMSLFHSRAKQPSLFCQLPLQGICWLHFAQCLWIFDFHRRQKGQEFWNSVEGQNGNLFAWSSFLLYPDIWHPLWDKIRVMLHQGGGGGLPVLIASSSVWTQELGIRQGSHRNRWVTLAL